MVITIEDRTILLLRFLSAKSVPGGGYGFWQRLSDMSGFPSIRWRQVYSRAQRMTSEMIAMLARLHPEYAFWLVTGITDAENGHVAPPTALTFPERNHGASDVSLVYFRGSLALLDGLLADVASSAADSVVAIERKRGRSGWLAGSLLDSAYTASRSAAYAALVEQARLRKSSFAFALEAAHLDEDARASHQSPGDLFYRVG